MLTNQSFNAFLKTLEEPPEHVKFLLATTDPQKLPVTVLSRCLQFNLKRMTPEHIVNHLRFVLGEENIPFEDPALWQLARAADGSMRDALSLTDQAIAFGNQKLAANDVSSMLGTIDQSDIETLVDALVRNDGAGLLAEIERIADFAPDFGAILADLLSLFHRVTMEQVVPGSAGNALGDAHRVQKLARELSAEDVQLFYQAALIGRKDLEITPDARMGFEMTLLRMLAFRPGAAHRDPPVNSAGRSGAGRESRSAGEGSSGESQPGAEEPAPAAGERPEVPAPETAAAPVRNDSPPPPPAEPEPPQVEEPASAPIQAPVASAEDESLMALADQLAAGGDDDGDDVPWDTGPETAPVGQMEVVSEPAPEPPEEKADEEPAPVETATTPPAPEPAAPSEIPEEPRALVDAEGFVWPRDFRTLGIVGMPGNLASQAACERDGNRFLLTLDEGHYRLLTSRHQEKILERLRAAFGNDAELQVVQGDAGDQTPIAWEARARARRQQQAEQSIAEDPLVQAIVERFEGRVVKESIRPLENPAG